MASARPRNSTIVRSKLVALRLAIRAVCALAPGLAARLVTRLWLTPPRPRVPAEMALPPPSFLLPVGELELPVWTFGDGPPVYLVHGWGGRADQLTGLVWPLVEAGHRVVLFDGPAHGRAPGRTSSGPAIAAALRAAVAIHGTPHAIVSHSFGAAPTALALGDGMVAGRVVLIAPPANLEGFVDRFGVMVGASRAVMRLAKARMERILGRPWSDFTLEALASRQGAEALVIHDRHDREVVIDEGEAVARTWPGARLHVTRGLGHRRILRDPEVIRRVVDFVAPRALDVAV